MTLDEIAALTALRDKWREMRGRHAKSEVEWQVRATYAICAKRLTSLLAQMAPQPSVNSRDVRYEMGAGGYAHPVPRPTALEDTDD